MEIKKTTDFELYDVVISGDEEEKLEFQKVELEGWVKTNRDNGSVGFVEFNDGTYFKNVQLVYNKDCKDYKEHRHALCQQPAPALDVRHQLAMSGFLQRCVEHEDKPRHQQEHRKHAAYYALNKDDAKVKAQPELHQGKSGQSRYRCKA